MRKPFGGLRRERPQAGPIPEQPPTPPLHQTPLFASLHLERRSATRPFDLLPDALVQVTARDVPAGELTLTDVGPVAAHLSVRAEGLGPQARFGLVGPDDAALLCGVEGARLVLRAGWAPGSAVLADSPLPSGTATLTLTGTTATVWDGTRPTAQTQVPADLFGDLRRADVVSTLTYAWAEVASAAAGAFGHVGLRDPQLVTDAFGAAVLREGRVLVTFTCAGPGDVTCAHWGLFSIDPANPLDPSPEAAVFFARDGLIVGDHAGQLIVQDEGADAIVSTWGTFDPADPQVLVRRAALPGLPGPGVQVVDAEPFPLPTDVSCWDPSLTRYAGYDYVGFTECWRFVPEFEFRPALARRRADDPHAAFDRIGADTMHLQTEGTLFVRERGEPLLLASDAKARDYPVYRLDMSRIGRVQAPYESGIPHPCLVRLPGRPAFMMTSDDTPWDASLPPGSHGDLVVYGA
ncbi:hypothetical protein [Brooklawnia cerclae]|uniref:Uncharacterized protein n=1 Tax=Brooklawnia cerclae TaxID=349934 RepID=A0ABX0SDU6_9ACTN|nr:hypothetical protein [Brooklawnia cerclae]NIH56529.1 hypothetical protein [Brooklawnia cerclae]